MGRKVVRLSWRIYGFILSCFAAIGFSTSRLSAWEQILGGRTVQSQTVSVSGGQASITIATVEADGWVHCVVRSHNDPCPPGQYLDNAFRGRIIRRRGCWEGNNSVIWGHLGRMQCRPCPGPTVPSAILTDSGNIPLAAGARISRFNIPRASATKCCTDLVNDSAGPGMIPPGSSLPQRGTLVFTGPGATTRPRTVSGGIPMSFVPTCCHVS